LMAIVRSVENAAIASGWNDAEVAWSLEEVQPVTMKALWCLMVGIIKPEAEGATEIRVLERKSEVLTWIVKVFEHTVPFGYDHLYNLNLLHTTMDVLRTRFVCQVSVEAPYDDLPPATARIQPWPPQQQGTDFMAAVKEKGLQRVLEAAGGVLQVTDFLPHEQALSSLATIKAVDPAEWTYSGKQDTVGKLTAYHSFARYGGKQLDSVRQNILQLAPGMYPIFEAGCYSGGDWITLHNDTSHEVVDAGDPDYRKASGYTPNTVVHRKIACIYYLTQDWKKEYGGCLVDNMQYGPEVIVPKFNSAVLFVVPREHWVTPMSSDAPLRYTVFGWFHDLDEPPINVPLGGGNPALGQERKDYGSLHIAPWLAKLPCASAAVDVARKANEVRSKCEQAFAKVFGIRPADLALDSSASKATGLLRQMRR